MAEVAAAAVAPPVAVAVPPSWEPSRRSLRSRLRRRWLMATAAVLLTVSVAARPVKAEIFDTAVLLAILEYLQTYMVPVLEMLIPLPDTMDGEKLQDVLDKVATASRSYLGGASPETILGTIFPEIYTVTNLDAASVWTILRDTDRREKVAESMNVARTVIEDIGPAADRADAYKLRNDLPLESTAAIGKLGNEISMEVAGSLKHIAQLQAEQAQLQADQAMQEEWQRRQFDLWERAHFGEQGFWSGSKSWTAETMPVMGGGD